MSLLRRFFDLRNLFQAVATKTITIARLQFSASFVSQFDLRTPAAAEAGATGKIVAAGRANQIAREA
jgi:hypothetical protein